MVRGSSCRVVLPDGLGFEGVSTALRLGAKRKTIPIISPNTNRRIPASGAKGKIERGKEAKNIIPQRMYPELASQFAKVPKSAHLATMRCTSYAVMTQMALVRPNQNVTNWKYRLELIPNHRVAFSISVFSVSIRTSPVNATAPRKVRTRTDCS